jgi:hypothetical protein
MANWPADPIPHLPKGFELDETTPRSLLHHEVYVTGSYTLYNEDLAIMRLEPLVHPEDFEELKTALRSFFHDIHQVRTLEIQCCALGDAYVRFTTTLDRERFLGPIFQFGNYSMSVIKHDEAQNARSFDLDREAWVMLVAFPEDIKDSVGIAKVVSSFGIMMHWHELENLARLVVKVFLNDDAKIPTSVKVNAGSPQKGRS